MVRECILSVKVFTKIEVQRSTCVHMLKTLNTDN